MDGRLCHSQIISSRSCCCAWCKSASIWERLSMQFAIGSLILDTDFLVAYGCGLIILILFCMERFNQPTSADGSFVETLVPRAVSNGHRYIQTFVIYAAIMVIVYTGLSIVG